MIKINLSTVQSVLAEYAIPNSELNAFSKVVRAQIMSEILKNLAKLAKSELKTSRVAYLQGVKIKPNSIELVGFLPNAIESGCQAFDMKEGFKKSSKVKMNKKGGWYLTIPFRIGTPNSSGVNFPAMPAGIYQAIKAGRNANLSNYGPGSRPTVANASTGKVWEQYSHKTSIFSGIQQNQNPVTGKSTYNTFRRVGANSDANSWINRGIAAHNLLDKAWQNTDVDKIINDGLENLLP